MVEHGYGPKDIVFGWFGLRLPRALKKRTFGYFLGVLGGQFISNGKRGRMVALTTGMSLQKFFAD